MSRRNTTMVLSEAMKYQVKADSMNALVAVYKKEYDRLPPSQKDAAKLRISEMELLAAEYQKIADDKFGNSGSSAMQRVRKLLSLRLCLLK